MYIFPAIDIIDGQVVRLYKGDYDQKTVYSSSPAAAGKEFSAAGARFIHIVDLDGARTGSAPNFDHVIQIKESSGLFCEIGGGIRNMDTVDRYLTAGIDRVIIGTAAVTNEDFVKEAVDKYGDKIAVGVDIKDGFVAIKGWFEKSQITAQDMCRRMQEAGVRTVICTDISKDGAMNGTNVELYRQLSAGFDIQITASGGVSSLDDVKALAELDLYGAIIGKAYYTGAIDLAEAVRIAGPQV